MLPVHSLYGVLPPVALHDDQFSKYTAVVTASPQNTTRSALAFSIICVVPHNGLVAVLHDTVLLWRVWRRELASHVELSTVLDEVRRGELSPRSMRNYKRLGLL